MHIDLIREKIAERLSESAAWSNKLAQGDPGPYVFIDTDLAISIDNIWVDIQSKTFTFKNVSYKFELQFISSREEDGQSCKFERTANGAGTFKFIKNNTDISVDDDFTIEMDVNYYKELFGIEA